MTFRIFAMAFLALLACGPTDLQIECHYISNPGGDPYSFCASLLGAPAVVVCPYAEVMTANYCDSLASQQCNASYQLECDDSANDGFVCLCECRNFGEYCEL